MKHRIQRTLCASLALASAMAVAQELPPEWQGVIAEPARARAAVPATPLEYADMRRTGDALGPRDYGVGDFALLSAARRGEWSKVTRLLAAGAQANVRDVWGDSVLTHAAAAGQTEVVRALLKAGARPDRRGSSGFTPLGAAALAGHAGVATLLLRAGADIDAKSANGHVPLIDAVMLDRSDVVAVLLRYRPDWRPVDRELGRHALSLAASLGHVKILDQLIAAGFDPDELDRGGFSALYWAVFRKQRLAVAHLLASGASAGAMSTDIYD